MASYERNAPTRDDIDSKSILPMQELDPSPVDENFPDISTEVHAPRYQPPTSTRSFGWPALGIRGQSWDSWLSAVQRYSTYPPTLFTALHFANTSLIPIATRSVAKSDNYFLLTRPIYQSPVFEHVILTIPILAHIASGIALRNIRSSRRARLYGAETRDQRYALSFWPRMSLQVRLGYAFAPLLATHVLVNRVVPVMVDGGSSSISLSFVAHGIARSRVFWATYYHIFVFVGVYHVLGGLASWMGWRITTARKTRGDGKGSLGGHLGFTESEQHVQRRKRMWWNFNKVAALGACIWLAGALWVVGNGGEGFMKHIGKAYRVLTNYLPSRFSSANLRVFDNSKYNNTRYPFHLKRLASRLSHIMSSNDVAGQLVQHDGKEYRVIREGRAYILKPPAETAATQATRRDLKPEDEDQTVFYNPIQQFNRDLTVLAIRVYGEHVMAVSKHKFEKRKLTDQRRNRKRKREDERNEESHEQGNKQDNEATATEEGKQQAPTTDPKANTHVTPFTILDALSASGLRALRYASEIPFVTRVVANDLSSSAIQSMKQNIEYNKLEKLIQPNTGDARIYMYNRLKPATKSNTRDDTGKFDVIDLDPYGTAAPFLDAAVQAVKDEGLLCITCTDAGVWASNGYPEKSFSLYGGVPMKGTHSHEGGLRLILNSVALSAGKYGLAIEPLLSLSIDFYARIFVRIHRSPAQVKYTSGNTMLVYNCDQGCGAWTTQPLTQTKQKLDKKGNPFYHFGFAQAPAANRNCEHCGMKTHLSGPMWAGPLHNSHYIQKILDLLRQVDRDVYQTIDRVEGMLTTALEEDLSLELSPEEAAEGTPSTGAPGDKNAPAAAELAESIIPQTDPAFREPSPFYFSLSSVSKALHTTTVPFYEFCGALRHLGYRCSRSHTKPNTVRTDASWAVIWEIMREWVRQKHPHKEGSIKPGTAAAGIMARSRQRNNNQDDDAQLVRLKKELASAVETGKDMSDVIARVEAALYRSGSRASLGKDETNPPNAPADGTAEISQQRNNSQGAKAQNDPPACSDFEVVFDESLGRQTRQRKRLVRYQVNPRANWGPLSRAAGGS
ncbi:S-adenosyl-L-methionine-dependent methyltransferase [Aspergillus undulatus]|uniref:S-adenosyl-L-methionine-dependent methyltransferase n=1 Tax=Aspergillus undulatus TaxID=1810928 RepID=UPI003CCD85F6